MPKRTVFLPNGVTVTGSRRSIYRTREGFTLKPRIDGVTTFLGTGTLSEMVAAWHTAVDLCADGILPTPALISAALHAE